MTVKVDDGNGPIGTVDGPQQGEGDGVVTAQGNDSRQSLPLDGRTPLVGIRSRSAGENVEMALLDLMEGKGVVITANPSASGFWGKCLSMKLTMSPGYLHSQEPWPSC
jgi:hypothetical protein